MKNIDLFDTAILSEVSGSLDRETNEKKREKKNESKRQRSKGKYAAPPARVNR
jgi:hypothetical protein